MASSNRCGFWAPTTYTPSLVSLGYTGTSRLRLAAHRRAPRALRHPHMPRHATPRHATQLFSGPQKIHRLDTLQWNRICGDFTQLRHAGGEQPQPGSSVQVRALPACRRRIGRITPRRSPRPADWNPCTRADNPFNHTPTPQNRTVAAIPTLLVGAKQTWAGVE